MCVVYSRTNTNWNCGNWLGTYCSSQQLTKYESRWNNKERIYLHVFQKCKCLEMFHIPRSHVCVSHFHIFPIDNQQIEPQCDLALAISAVELYFDCVFSVCSNLSGHWNGCSFESHLGDAHRNISVELEDEAQQHDVMNWLPQGFKKASKKASLPSFIAPCTLHCYPVGPVLKRITSWCSSKSNRYV